MAQWHAHGGRAPHKDTKMSGSSLPIAARAGIMTTKLAIGTPRSARLMLLIAALFTSAVTPASAFVSPRPHHQTHPWCLHRAASSDGADEADADDGTDDPPPASKTAPVATRPGVNGPVRLSSPSRVDDYKSPVNFEAGVTKGPGPLSPRWSDSGRWEKDQDRKAESGEQSAGEQQFLLKEKYGTYFRVPNPATLMTSESRPCASLSVYRRIHFFWRLLSNASPLVLSQLCQR